MVYIKNNIKLFKNLMNMTTHITWLVASISLQSKMFKSELQIRVRERANFMVHFHYKLTFKLIKNNNKSQNPYTY